jgi:hypothetical protein
VANERCGAIEKWQPREMGSKRETSIALEKWKPSTEMGGKGDTCSFREMVAKKRDGRLKRDL